MHEVHLVRELVSKIEAEAAAKGAARVTKIAVQFNPLTSHDAEHVRFSFDLVKKESPMVRDAELALTEVAPDVSCEKCGHQFAADSLPNVCPKCGGVSLKPLNPTDMILQSLEFEQG